MTDEVHEVVELLVARMKSHPEEFRVADAPFHDRWYDHVNAIQAFGSEADKAAMAEGLRKIRLAETHERVMDELLNGEDRRRKEEEEREYERQMLRQGGLVQQQKAYVNQLQGMVGQVYGGGGSGVYGGGGGAGIVGKSYSSAIMDEYDSDLDKYRNTPTGSITSAIKPKPSPYDKIMNALKKGK